MNLKKSFACICTIMPPSNSSPSLAALLHPNTTSLLISFLLSNSPLIQKIREYFSQLINC